MFCSSQAEDTFPFLQRVPSLQVSTGSSLIFWLDIVISEQHSPPATRDIRRIHESLLLELLTVVTSVMRKSPRGASSRCCLVERLLLDPDRGAGDRLAPHEVATEDVLAELGRVHSAATGRLDAEAPLEQPL